jgi:hypothetical protein
MWGSGEGMEFDVAEPPKRLDGVMIRAGDIIDSFGFSYTDRAGKKHTVGPYGGSGGSLTSVSNSACSVCSTLLIIQRCIVLIFRQN